MLVVAGIWHNWNVSVGFTMVYNVIPAASILPDQNRRVINVTKMSSNVLTDIDSYMHWAIILTGIN